MGAIKDRSVVEVEQAINFSKVDAGYDCDGFIMSLILDGVKEAADYVCQNRFVLREDGAYFGTDIIYDDDGEEQPIDIPAGVEMWILRKFARIVQYPMAGNNLVTDAEIGSVKLDARDWAELNPYIDHNAKSRTTEDSESNLSYRGQFFDRDSCRSWCSDDGWLFSR